MNTPSPPPITSSRWGSRTKRIVVLLSLVAIGFFLWQLIDIFPLIIVSMLLSYLLWPAVNFFERRILWFLPFGARSLAVVFTFILVIALITIIVIVIVPVLVNQIAEVGRSIPRIVDQAEVELERILSKPITINGSPLTLGGEPVIPLDRIREIAGAEGETNLIQLENFDIFQALGTFIGSIGGLTGPAFDVLGGALNVVINMAFVIIIMFYFMRDGERFISQFVNVIPESYRGDVRRMLYELGRVWNAYLRGQLILSSVIGGAVYVAALAVGLPNAPILGLIAGLLEFIPNLGPTLALLPAMTIALVSESSTIPFLSGIPFALVVILVWTAIQNLEALFLVPRVMGGSLNLHPVVVIIAVIAGASIGGALGVILAAPFTATGRLLGQYLYGKIFDKNPFPSPEREAAPRSPGWLPRLYVALLHLKPIQLFRQGQQLARSHAGGNSDPSQSPPANSSTNTSTVHQTEEEAAP